MTLDNTRKYNDEPDDTVKVDDETERWIREAGLGESGSEARKRRRKMEKLRAEWEKKDADPSVQYNMLEVRPANDWMNFLYEDRPSRRLFGDLWRENDLSILFADTGVGKSVLAVQIADSIARGEQIEPLTMNVDAQKVLYLDFEMSEQQFTERYSATSGDGQTFANKYVFPDDFLVAHIDSDTDLPKRFKTVVEYMYASIVGRIEESGARILIVDNISYLSPTAGGSSSALKLMKALKYLKSHYKLSILVLAHTTKRHFASPLTVNDLAGSKTLANFADNVFTIGHSHYDRNLRYIKQIKQRNNPVRYDATNVLVYRLEKPSNFPRFNFLRYNTEAAYLQARYDTLGQTKRLSNNRRSIVESAKRLSQRGQSQRRIAAELGISKATVNRYLNAEPNQNREQ